MIDYKIEYKETGEFRAPLTGEWFKCEDGKIERARFDFTVQKFKIVKEIITPGGALNPEGI